MIKFVVIGECLEAVTVKVFFIDEGFSAIIPLGYLRPLPNKYATMLPSQSFHCILGGVQPTEALKREQMLSFGKGKTYIAVETKLLFFVCLYKDTLQKFLYLVNLTEFYRTNFKFFL